MNNKRELLKGNSHENLWTDPLNDMNSLFDSKNTAYGSWNWCALGLSSSNGLLFFSSYHECKLSSELCDETPAENDKETDCWIKFVSIHFSSSYLANGEGLWLHISSKTSNIGLWRTREYCCNLFYIGFNETTWFSIGLSFFASEILSNFFLKNWNESKFNVTELSCINSSYVSGSNLSLVFWNSM